MSSVRSRNSQGKGKEAPKETGADAHDPNVSQDVEVVVTPKPADVASLTKPKSIAGKSTNGISSVKGGGSQVDTRNRTADEEHDGKKVPKKVERSLKEHQQLEKAEADYQKLIRADEEKTKRDDAAKAKRAAELAAKAPRPAVKPATGTNRAPVPARLEGAGRAAALKDGNLFSAPSCIFSQTIRNQRYYPVRRLYRYYPITRPTPNSSPVLRVPSALMPPPWSAHAWTRTPRTTTPVPGSSKLQRGFLMFRRYTWHAFHVDDRPRLRDCPSTRMCPTVSRSGYSDFRVNNGRPGVPLVARRTYVVCTSHLAELTGNPHRLPRPPHPRPPTGCANGRLPNGSPRPPHPRHVCFCPGTLTDPICVPQLNWEGRCKTRCK